MGMTFDEMKQLLAFCAVFDKRKGDQLDVKAWLMVAEDHRWTAPAALRVAREHYGAGAGRPRLEPAAITDRIRQIRKQAAESFDLPCIPEDLSNADYPAWLRAQRDAHCASVVDRWASTGEEPPRSLPPAPIVVGTRKELEAAAPPLHKSKIAPGLRKLYDRTIAAGGVRRPKTVEQRANARAELDRIRATTEDAG